MGTLEIAKKADLLIQPTGASRADLIPAVKEFNALKKELNNRTAKPTDYQRKRKVFIREKVHYLGKK